MKKTPDWLKVSAPAALLPLEGGRALRLLTETEEMQVRREAMELAVNEMDLPLCSNACLVARALVSGGASETAAEVAGAENLWGAAHGAAGAGDDGGGLSLVRGTAAAGRGRGGGGPVSQLPGKAGGGPVPGVRAGDGSRCPRGKRRV